MTAQSHIHDFLAEVSGRPAGQVEASSLDWSLEATDDELYALFASLVSLPTDQLSEAHLISLFRTLLGRDWGEEVHPPNRLPDWFVGQAAGLYRKLGPPSRARAYLAQLVTATGNAELAPWVEWVIADPPRDLQATLISFAPLFQRTDFDPSYVFPRLFDAMIHPPIAASVVDLANRFADDLLERHPATDRTDRFISLLGELTQELTRLEENLGHAPGDAAQLAAAVEESVSLAVALCRALALIGDEAAIGKLFQALELKHRRLRVEAAAALAALDQPAGIESLAALAAEPIVRLRVLAFAEELRCLDQIEEQYQTDQARAEAELALWLAQPSQLGMPPTTMECVDQRTQYWPGYENEIACFLFRYTYQFSEDEFSNIGIAGPLTHAFSADIGDLPPDDIYAAFAGWQAEHEEIYELDAAEFEEAHRVEQARLERRLRDEGYSQLRPVRMGYFFGDRALITRASRGNVEGIAVVDRDAVQWRSTANQTRPLGPDEMYWIYKGKKLLRNFNE